MQFLLKSLLNLMVDELRQRPALILFLGLVTGISICVSPLYGVLGVLSLCFLLRDVCKLACCGVGFGLGFIIGFNKTTLPITETAFFNSSVRVVTFTKVRPWGSSCVVENRSDRYLLRCKKDMSLCPGEVIQFMGVVKPLTEGSTVYWSQRSVKGVLSPYTPIKKIKAGPRFWYIGKRLQNSFTSFTDNFLHPKAKTVVDALCMNDCSQMGHDFFESIQRSGVLHIFSISGLHIILVASFLSRIMSFLPLPRYLLLIVLAVCLFLYVSATGFQVPALRALIMAMISLSAFLWYREPDSLSALAIAGMVCLILFPTSAFDLGFQLSFICTAALTLFCKPLDVVPSLNGVDYIMVSIKSLVSVTCVATCAAAPLLLYHFNHLSLTSIFATLMLVPLAPLLMVGILMSWFLSFIWLAASVGLLKMVVEPLGGWFLFVVEVFGNWRYATFYVPPFDVCWIILTYVLLLMLWRPRVRPA